MVEPRGDFYWRSEVRYRGKLVPFRAQFLLHLESVAGGTQVEVLEYFPEMRLGKKLGLGAHGPGLFDDIRVATPTNRDRQELRALVERAARGSAPAPTR